MKCVHAFLAISLLLSLSFSYKLRCPDPSHWAMRASLLCPDPSNYSCVLDGNTGIFIENCTWVDLEPKGRRSLICGIYESEFCSTDRYHPFIYWTNISSDCIYTKSLCNEEGQVIYDDSVPYQDTKCSCDHTRGYDFVTKPSNPCYCVPSEEDCSCYLNPCNIPNTQASYRCSETANFTCLPFKNNTFDSKEDPRPYNGQKEQKTKLSSGRGNRCRKPANSTSQNDTSVKNNMNNSKEDTRPYNGQKEQKTKLSSGRGTDRQKLMGYDRKFDGQKEQVKTVRQKLMDNFKNLATLVICMCISVIIGFCGIVLLCLGRIHKFLNYHVKKVYVIRPLSSKSCYEGDTCNLECEISKPNIIYWYKENSILVEGKCECVHTLPIRNMSKENEGTYEVRSSLKKKLSTASVQYRPVFVAGMDYQTCIEGDTISFICEVSEDDMEVEWFKGDETEYKDAILTGSDRLGKTRRLQISNTKLSDTGFYWIKTKNVTRKGKLTVKAYIKTHLKENIGMVIGTKDHLTCETEKTGIKATWYKDGKEITASDNITINESDGVYRLNIRNVSLQNKGQYKIIIDKHSSECCVDVKDILEHVDVNV